MLLCSKEDELTSFYDWQLRLRIEENFKDVAMTVEISIGIDGLAPKHMQLCAHIGVVQFE